ncbi:hypothetical protein Y032_0030g2224 [Ancylostoma ceylanicum]|uniref:Uncharacterized protein n=1 Tax=Ancylostoma ceylanicum TaxID=53326 RepID=A0A016UQM3_9BILA|nr:hypothetical protein Y032_0030g2224 [Ancylostoma ceylanicum]
MAEDKKTISMLLYRYDVPRINITYKNRKDLFRTFKKELRKHHLSIDEVAWADRDDGARSVIRNADDLFGAVANSNETRMYCRPRDGYCLFTPPNSDDEGEIESTQPAGETKRISIKLYRDNIPRITITYKDKKDLFKQFQKKIEQLSLPPGEVYWADWWEDELYLIETADDLLKGVQSNNNIMKMYYLRKADDNGLRCHSSDED